MIKYLSIIIVSMLYAFSTTAQVEKTKEMSLPYVEIPAAPEKYTAGSTVARVVDGLGYRYYWATDGLTDTQLNYEPGNEGRKTADVLEHLYGLSSMIVNATLQQPNIRPMTDVPTTFTDLRAATLRNLYQASQHLRKVKDSDLEHFEIVFQRGEKTSRFPFWNLLNGPLDDALTHVGQIVSFRRSAGLPQNPKVNVFMGKNRN